MRKPDCEHRDTILGHDNHRVPVFFCCRDLGTTWTDVSGDLPPGSGAAAMTFSNDGLYLFISRYAGGVYKMKIQAGREEETQDTRHKTQDT
jgi:hypothetical protein